MSTDATESVLRKIARECDWFQLHSPMAGVRNEWALVARRRDGNGMAESYAADSPGRVADDFLNKRHPNYDPSLRGATGVRETPAKKLKIKLR